MHHHAISQPRIHEGESVRGFVAGTSMEGRRHRPYYATRTRLLRSFGEKDRTSGALFQTLAFICCGLCRLPCLRVRNMLSSPFVFTLPSA
jgi:hypothetical protein